MKVSESEKKRTETLREEIMAENFPKSNEIYEIQS